MAVHLHIDRNVGGNNSNSSLPGVEDDTDARWAHVSFILWISRASHLDGVPSKSLFWLAWCERALWLHLSIRNQRPLTITLGDAEIDSAEINRDHVTLPCHRISGAFLDTC